MASIYESFKTESLNTRFTHFKLLKYIQYFFKYLDKKIMKICLFCMILEMAPFFSAKYPIFDPNL